MTHEHRNVPRLPPPGWMPDPSDTELERLWDGTRWTGRTRDRYTRVENVPNHHLAYYPRATLTEVQPREPRKSSRLGVILVIGGLAIAYMVALNYGALPAWAMPFSTRSQAEFVPPPPADFSATQALQEQRAAEEAAQAQAEAEALKPATASDMPTYGSNDMVRTLEQALMVQQPVIDVTEWAWGGDTERLQDALDELQSQNPYIYVQGWSAMSDGARVTLEPKYTYDLAEAQRRQAATDKAAADALVTSGALSATSDAAKVTAIHDYIVEHATYDYGAFEDIEQGMDSPRIQQSQEAFGILVMGTAVCKGYAMAFQVMAEAAGLDSVIVTGSDTAGLTGGSHAWNMVTIDGEWLVVDVTWDDPLGAETVQDDYLLIRPDDPILDTRTTDDGWVMDDQRAQFDR